MALVLVCAAGGCGEPPDGTSTMVDDVRAKYGLTAGAGVTFAVVPEVAGEIPAEIEGDEVRLGSGAFRDEETLARTMGHQLVHLFLARSLGDYTDTEEGAHFAEWQAYAWEACFDERLGRGAEGRRESIIEARESERRAYLALAGARAPLPGITCGAALSW